MAVLPNSPYSRDVEFHLHPQTNGRLHEAAGPRIITRGEGIHVHDLDGSRYIEGMSGLWCASLGFSNRRLADAAHRQMLELPYQQIFAHRGTEPSINLAEALVARAPAGLTKAMFQSSGSEGVDTAIKLVWYYHAAIGKPEKRKIIGRMRAYHGTTIGSASLTGLPNMHKGWGLPLPGFVHVSCPHHYRFALEGETETAFAERLAAELEATILREGPETVGAFFAEPVMGTGGVIVPPAGYFDLIQPILRKYDVLMVADEVICGFGRTGHYWGCDAFDIQPDMLVCAKGLSSAYFPISAVLLTDAIYQVIADQTNTLGGFGHGYTYGGHPVGAAVALETLAIYDEIDVVARAKRLGRQLQAGFQGFACHPLVGEARGIGMMAALELVADKAAKTAYPPEAKVAARVAEALKARGVLLRALGETLLCAPPLIIEAEEVDVILAAVKAALDQVWHEIQTAA